MTGSDAVVGHREVQGARAGPDPGPMLDRLQRLISDDPRNPYGLSGAVFAVSGSDGGRTVVSLGSDARGRPIGKDVLFTLSSGSKLAIGLLVLRSVEAGQIDLSAGIGEVLPEAKAARVGGVTVRRLLNHTAGLPLEVAHDLSTPPGPVRWEAGLRWPGTLAAACLATEPVLQPGSAVRYSNVGYGLLALAVERAAGQPFERLLDRLVFEPLGIEAYVDRRPDRPLLAVADVPSPHVGTPLEPYNSEFSHRLGAPWASVITDIEGFLTLARAYGDDSPILAPETARLARADQTGGVGGGFPAGAYMGFHPTRAVEWTPCPWGLGVELQGGKRPFYAPTKMPRSFGHSGSAGGLAWCDPDSGVAWAIQAARTANSGWLLLHGPKIAAAAVAAAA